MSFPAGKATLTGGVVGYIYPNDLTDESNGGLDSEAQYRSRSTARLELDVPLSPDLAIYYDVDKIKGALLRGRP